MMATGDSPVSRLCSAQLTAASCTARAWATSRVGGTLAPWRCVVSQTRKSNVWAADCGSSGSHPSKSSDGR